MLAGSAMPIPDICVRRQKDRTRWIPTVHPARARNDLEVKTESLTDRGHHRALAHGGHAPRHLPPPPEPAWRRRWPSAEECEFRTGLGTLGAVWRLHLDPD